MALPKIRLYLQCCGCDSVEFCGPEQIVNRLRHVGMLRRNAEPDAELMRELMEQARGQFACSKCDHQGMKLSDEDPFDDDAWGDPVKCENCSSTIPAERIEIFPDTKLCMKCQSGVERGETTEEPDFCPRCGDVMQMRRSSGAGVAGYRLVCPSCSKVSCGWLARKQEIMTNPQVVARGRIIAGHQVASGQSGDTRYPLGTLGLQLPIFAKLGIPVEGFFAGTLNIDLAPRRIRVDSVPLQLRSVRWTEHHPPEDFYFFPCEMIVHDSAHRALVYMPSPETKQEHFQQDTVLELLAEFIEDVAYGDAVELRFDQSWLAID